MVHLNKHKYKIEYASIFHFQTFNYVLFEKRFKCIWWPKIIPSSLDVHGSSDLTQIKYFTGFARISHINSRPAWFFVYDDQIETFHFNDFSELNTKFAEYLI